MRLPDTNSLHSGTLADVLDALGSFSGFDSAIRSLNGSSARFLGQAYTVRWAPIRKSSSITAPQPSTWQQVRDFLVPGCPAPKGMVYVAGTENGALVTNLALAGGFSSDDFQRRGFAAMVLGGAIRDAHVVAKLHMPVWGTNFIPADTQGSYRVVETGTWAQVGHQLVETGDYLFGDESGLIRIPARLAQATFEAAAGIEATEERIARLVSSGRSLYEVVEELGRL